MTNDLKIKVCGMRDKENIRQLVGVQPDYIGFIFYPKSKRYVGNQINPEIISSIPNHIQKVGVFVNEPLQGIIKHIENNTLDLIQLHGNESPDFCKQLKSTGKKIIKAFRISNSFNFKQLNEYKNITDYFLFDTFTENYGGSGKKFDWKMLDSYDNEVPIFLSGGISMEDTKEIKKLSWLNIHSLDINSRFEIEPALKNIDTVKLFINSIRND